MFNVTNNPYITLTPAYGRDYKSKKQILEDFDNERDFMVQPSNQYINKQQITWPCTINFRYKQLRSVFVHQHAPTTPRVITLNLWSYTADITITSECNNLLIGEFTHDGTHYKIGLTYHTDAKGQEHYIVNIIQNKETGKQVYPPLI